MMATSTHNPLGVDPCDEQDHPIFNTTTQKRNVVDARTGLFEAYVPLPKITANEGRGPVVDLSLFYTPVVNNHACLGDGWSFAFTYYNGPAKKLKLAGGEVLDYDRENTDITIGQVRLLNADGVDGFFVSFADERVEKLVRLEGTDLYFPNTFITADWQEVNLHWEAVEENQVTYIQLRHVSDSVRRLAIIDYGMIEEGLERTVTLTLWPDDSTETQTYAFKQSEYALRSILAPDGRTTVLDYLDHKACGWLLNHLISFDGVEETVVYEDNGLSFRNDKKLSALPCVSRHTLHPLGDCPTAVTRYKYIKSDAGEGYQTRMTQDGRVTSIVYSADHEVVKQEEYYGISKTRTTYDTRSYKELGYRTIKKIHSLEAIAQVSAPLAQSTEWWDGKISARVESGCVQDYFHSSGESTKCYEDVPMWQSKIASSTACDDACKAAAEVLNGKRLLGSYYFSNTDNWLRNPFLIDAATFVTSGQSGLNPTFIFEFMRQDSSSSSSTPFMMKCTAFNEFLKPTKMAVGLKHSTREAPCWITINNSYGAVEGQAAFIPNASGKLAAGRLLKSQHPYFTYTYDYALDGTALTMTTTQKAGHSSRVSSETHSILSGRLIKQQDHDGNVSSYDYDAHGRLTTFTQCAQSEAYKQVTTYSYPTLGRVETVEPDGQRCATEEDGQGNVLAEYVYDTPTKAWRQMLKVDYDPRGRKCKTTLFDYLADGRQISQSCELRYDDWGEECEQIFSDGKHVFNEYDPINRTRTEWTGKATDKERKVTTYNDDNSAAKVECKGSDGEVWLTQTFTYTHAFQVEKQVTDGKYGYHEVSYTYDASGRLLTEAHVEKASAAETTNTMAYDYTYEYPENITLREASKISLDGQVLGERTFDVWGRVTSITRGGVTETFTYDGAAPVPNNRTDATGQMLDYTYIPELGQQVESVTVRSSKLKKSFTYMHGATRNASASEGEQMLEFNYDLSERLAQQRAALSKKATTTFTRTSSPAGRLLGEADATGASITYSYNDKGQRTGVMIDKKSVATHAYDHQGRKLKDVVTQGADDMSVAYEHDASDRETRRRFGLSKSFDLSIKRTYREDGNLAAIALYDEAQNKELGSHAYQYSSGGRLTQCESTGVWRPQTPKGKSIDKQVFVHGPLGNVTQCITYFGTEQCTSTYSYEADKGYRLQKVAHDHADYKKEIKLEYDVAGRVTRDINGKTYSYDWLGRLTQSGSRYYTYDPSDRVVSHSSESDKAPHQILYDGYKVRGEFPVNGGTDARRILPGSAACQVQLNKAGSETRTLVNLCDEDGTVLITFDPVSRTLRHHTYSAYGQHSSEEQQAIQGFNGEYHDEDNEQYSLGHGYRWYSPQSMQFNAQDSLSPFDEGGPHVYGYCNGDPVNYSDPTGHWKMRYIPPRRGYAYFRPVPLNLGKASSLVSTILWAGIGVLTAVMTGGTSLIITGILVTLALASMATAIASVVIAETNPKAAAILGWVSLGLTVAGGVGQLGAKLVRLAARLARSGLVVARRLSNKVVIAAQHFKHKVGRAILETRGIYSHPARARFYDVRYVSKSVDSMPDYKSLSELTKPVSEAFETFEIGDANTVVCCVTGVLNNAGTFEDEGVAWASSQVNNSTWLPWGSFGLGKYPRAPMIRGSGLRFR